MLAVEPNIYSHESLNIVSLEIGLESDICAYLVAHSEFHYYHVRESDLDFCGLVK